MSIADTLGQVPIFADVGREQLESLVKFAQEVDVPAGAELTHEGRYEGSVYVVVAGQVAIERNDRVVDTIGPGELVGEIAAIDGGPRTATARAVVDSRVIVLSQVRFNEVLETSPGLRDAAMRSMEERLARIDAEA